MNTPAQDNTFGENGQTYYDEQNVARWVIAFNCNPQWADCTEASGYRTCCTSHTWVGPALAARIMGGMAFWNHEAFFDYVDRWMIEDDDAGDLWVRDMWNMYR